MPDDGLVNERPNLGQMGTTMNSREALVEMRNRRLYDLGQIDAMLGVVFPALPDPEYIAGYMAGQLTGAPL